MSWNILYPSTYIHPQTKRWRCAYVVNYKDIYNTDICLGTFYTLLHISTHKQKDGDVLM